MRYSATERLGVIETDYIVTKHLRWIFREQPIVDVGIDAIIEKVDNGNPAGKFIAIQIKSGEKNFYIKEEYLTYYVSNIHYNYWLNLNLPIIIVAYLPNTDKCYWQIINKKTLIKTKNKWKIIIPKKNFFIDSKEKISEFLVEIDTDNIFSKIYEYDIEFDLSDELILFSESLESTNRTRYLLDEFSEKSNIFSTKNNDLVKKGYVSTSPKLKGYIKYQSRYFTSISYRFISEIKIFSEVFPEELYYLEQLIYLNKESEIPVDIVLLINKMKKSLNNLADTIENLSELHKNVIKTSSNMKKARKCLAEAFEAVSYEYSEGSVMVEKLTSKRFEFINKT